MADVRVEVGLVLQGGGALGAYEWGAVSALLELMNEAAAHGRDVELKCVCGVSIGAVNAACVVGSTDHADARRRLQALWTDLTLNLPEFWPDWRLDLSAVGGPCIDTARDLSLFGLPAFYAPRQDIVNFANWTSYYDTHALIGTLERHVDFAALNASPTRFVVSAVDVTSGELTRFSNHPAPPQAIAKTATHKHAAEPIGPRHILASGSLPPQFPWTAIDGHRYWDGGIVDNAPLGEAVDAFSPGEDVTRLLIAMNLYPLRGRLPRNLSGVNDRLHELQLGNRLRQDRATARRINALVETIEELKALVPQDRIDAWLAARLDEAASYKVLDSITEIELQAAGAAQDPRDDEFGLRDFSAATIQRRRSRGHARAMARLVPLFESHGLIETACPRELRASA